MKTKTGSLLSVLCCFFLFSFTSEIDLNDATPLNLEESQITWKGYKVTGKHAGTIGLKSGNFTYDDGKLTGGEIYIDMQSLKVTDLKGEYAGKLEGHLKSDDFFGVNQHPTAHFKITKVVSRGSDGDYKVIGDLTIKNITKEIRFQAKVSQLDGHIVAKADISIDRSDYDVRYGSGSFFDNLGDKTIYDEFDLSLNLVTE